MVRGERRRRNLRERRKAFKEARWRATPVWAKWMLGLTASGVILALVAGFVLMVVAGFFEMDFAPWVGQLLAISILGSLFSLIGAGVVMSVVDDRAAIRALLSMRVCVRCFYDLRGSPEDGEVCRCPECGTAWRVGVSDA